MFLYALGLIVIIAVIAAVYVRVAPDYPARWHRDPVSVTKTAKDNDFVVAPSGGDMDSPLFDMSPAALMAKVHGVAMAQPNTTLLGDRDGYATYIQRTAKMAYPDYITVKAVEAEGGSKLHIYSRSRYGLRDFGVNKARVLAWLKKL